MMENNQKKHLLKTKHFVVFGIAMLLSPAITHALEDEVVTLPEYSVNGYTQGSLFNRSGAGTDDLFALDPMEFERSVSFWDSEELKLRGLSDVEGMLEKIPGGYAPARFGVVTVPNIRGDAAETFFNGQRRGDNLFGMRPTFQTLESIEILMGPGTVSEGPGKRTGGLVNFLSKRARPGLFFGEVEIGLGTWVPSGGSYLSTEGNLDINYGLGDGKAFRVNLYARDDDTYFKANGGRNDAIGLYLTYHYETKEKLQWDFVATYDRQRAPQTLGVNRPWQGLIDNNLYLTGGVDNSLGQSTPPGIFDPGIADPGLVTAGPSDLVHIERDRVLMSQGDYGNGESILGQSLLSKEIDGDSRISQQTLVEYVDRSKLNQFYYAEAVRQLTLDGQLQWEKEAQIGAFQSQTELGAQLRWEERNNYSNYWNEFAYAFDITTARRFNAYESFPSNIAFGGVLGPDGLPWYLPGSIYATPESTQSFLGQAGLYLKQAFETESGWKISGGVRVDGYTVKAREVMMPVGRDRWEDSDKILRFSGHISLEKKLDYGMLYLTYGKFSGVAGSTVGDGINLNDPGIVRNEDFENETELFEIGTKWAVGNWLNVAASGYIQERTRPEFFGSNDIKVEGFELQLDITGQETWGGSLTIAVMDAHYVNSTPAEFGGGSIQNVYAVGAGPTGEGNGIGYIQGFFVNSLAPGDYEIPGLSDYTLRTSVWYAPVEMLRLSLWGTWQSEQKGNLAGEFFIPEQGTLNASVNIRLGDWELLISGYNITNEDNWLHNGDTFFDQMLISRELPARYSCQLRFKF